MGIGRWSFTDVPLDDVRRVLDVNLMFGLSRAEPAPDTAGNLYVPAVARAAVHGGWNGERRERRRRGPASVPCSASR